MNQLRHCPGDSIRERTAPTDVMRKKTVIGIILLAFCIACRLSVPFADFYAEHCYPLISTVLSRIGSIVKFSLEEIIVLAFAVTLVDILVKTIRRKEGLIKWLRKTVVVLMWLYIWFYMGWGNNYYRTGLYVRNGIQRVHFEKETFDQFLEEYTAGLNGAAEKAGSYGNSEKLEEEIRGFYTSEAVPYGYTKLRRWQHAKLPLLNRLYSAVGVLGYMGPFLCESQLNRDLLEYEYPFTAAHEMGHLAGVTSEAEANYWGFAFCRQSANPGVRYSGYLAVFPYVASNARALLPEEEYEAWIGKVCEKAKEDYKDSREYWLGKRIGWIDQFQSWFYNLYLKSNGVSEGIKDYSGVVGMIITMDAYNKQPTVI